VSVREVFLMGEPVLREPAAPVVVFDEALRTLVREMFETMYAEEGIGLAAPQVGVSQRVVVVDLRREDEPEARVALVNPRVVWSSDDTEKQPEGCLSIPGIEEVVERPWAVRIEGFDPNGQPVTIEADELFSRALQHEIDHLDGVLFLDRVSPLARKLAVKRWKKLQSEAEAEGAKSSKRL
jgi:peptide deformylase